MTMSCTHWTGCAAEGCECVCHRAGPCSRCGGPMFHLGGGICAPCELTAFCEELGLD